MDAKKPQFGVDGRKSWDSEVMLNFGETVGVSLDVLGKEYEDMMINFETQKAKLKNFTPKEEAIQEETKGLLSPPSPTPSNSSRSSPEKGSMRKRVFSSAGMQASIRMAKNSIRRKLSSRKRSVPHVTLQRSSDHASVSSLSKPDSETSSMEHESEVLHKQ